MSKITTAAEIDHAELRSAGEAEASVPKRTAASATGASKRYGWLSRLRSYFIFDPLIWAYTLVLGIISLICSLFDRGGRIQHNLASCGRGSS